MQKVTIVVPKDILVDIIIKLGKLGYVSLIHPKEDTILNFKKETPTEYHKITLLIDNIEKIIEKLSIDIKKLDEEYAETLKNVEIRLYTIDELSEEYMALEDFFNLDKQIDKLKKELEGLELIKKIAKKHPKAIEIYAKKTSKLLKIPKENTEHIEKTFKTLALPHIILIQKKFSLVLVDMQEQEIEDALAKFLEDCEAQKIDLPKNIAVNNIEDLNKQIEKYKRQIQKLEETIDKNKESKKIQLIKLYRKATITHKILTIQSAIYKSKYTAIISCTIPDEKTEEFKQIITKQYKNKIMLAIEKPPETPKNMIPLKL